MKAGEGMKWNDARQKYPTTWVLFEAMESYSVEGQRIVKDLSIIDAFAVYIKRVIS